MFPFRLLILYSIWQSKLNSINILKLNQSLIIQSLPIKKDHFLGLLFGLLNLSISLNILLVRNLRPNDNWVRLNLFKSSSFNRI